MRGASGVSSAFKRSQGTRRSASLLKRKTCHQTGEGRGCSRGEPAAASGQGWAGLGRVGQGWAGLGSVRAGLGAGLG